MAGERRGWTVSEHVLNAMTPEIARGLLIECLVEVHVEAESGSHRHWPVDSHQLRDRATRAVKEAFKDLGYDFMQPDAASCRMVIEQLSRDSRLNGVPAGVVEYHVGEYARVLHALEQRAAEA